MSKAKQFQLKLRIIADNSYSFFIDGNPVGGNPNSWDGQVVDSYVFDLSPGQHVLAIEAMDYGLFMGVLASLGLSAESQVAQVPLVTTREWKVSASTDVPPLWNTLGFDDSQWGAASDRGSVNPWGQPEGSQALVDRGAKWIWGPDVQPFQTVYLRASFTLEDDGSITPTTPPPPPTNSKLTILSDNNYEAYLNGVLIGRNQDSWARGVDAFDLRLEKGNYVLAIKAEDYGDPASLIASIRRGSSSLVSSPAWRVTTQALKGWNQLGFNDANWFYATDHGTSWWGRPIDINKDFPAATKWIWDADISVDTVYMRAAFSVNDRNQIVPLKPPAKANKAPVVSVKKQIFEPGQVINVGSSLATLFSVNDPDGDVIATYKFFDSNPDKDSGFFRNRVTKTPYTSNDGSNNEFSVIASQLGEVEWVAGRNGSSDGIRMIATDVRGKFNNWQPDNTLWSARTNPVISLSQPAEWSYVYAGTPRNFYDFVTVQNDPRRESIAFYTIADTNRSSTSGYFTLNSQRLTDSSIQVSAKDIPNLIWNFGNRNTADTISVIAMDEAGRISNEATTTFRVGRAPTAYAIESASGFNHVTEGSVFSLNIKKLDNFDKSTTLRWRIFNAPEEEITAARDDFAGIKNEWNTITFPTTAGDFTLNLRTLLDKTPEVSETARIWFYRADEGLDNGRRDWLTNPAYSYLDFGIHDRPFYAMGPSTINVEGESPRMSVARFGGDFSIANQSRKSSIEVKARNLRQLYPGSGIKINNIAGLAQGGADSSADFLAISQGLDFYKDGVAQQVLTQLTADRSSEPAEIFAWIVTEPGKDAVLNSRLGGILEQPSSAKRDSSADPGAFQVRSLSASSSSQGGLFDFLSSGMSWLWGKTLEILGLQTPAIDKLPEQLRDTSLATVTLPPPQENTAQPDMAVANVRLNFQPAANPGKIPLTAGPSSTQASPDRKGRDTLIEGGLGIVANGGGNLKVSASGEIKVQGGNAIVANGGGNLVAQGGGNMIAQGGGNLVANGGGNITSGRSLMSVADTNIGPVFIATPGGMYLSADGGVSISPLASQAMNALRDLNGKPLDGSSLLGL